MRFVATLDSNEMILYVETLPIYKDLLVQNLKGRIAYKSKALCICGDVLLFGVSMRCSLEANSEHIHSTISCERVAFQHILSRMKWANIPDFVQSLQFEANDVEIDMHFQNKSGDDDDHKKDDDESESFRAFHLTANLSLNPLDAFFSFIDRMDIVESMPIQFHCKTLSLSPPNVHSLSFPLNMDLNLKSFDDTHGQQNEAIGTLEPAQRSRGQVPRRRKWEERSLLLQNCGYEEASRIPTVCFEVDVEYKSSDSDHGSGGSCLVLFDKTEKETRALVALEGLRVHKDIFIEQCRGVVAANG